MVNLNKESIKKIKDIDAKADNIISKAEKNSEDIISKVRHELPNIIKEAQTKRDKTKSEKIDSSKKEIEEEAKEKIASEIAKIKSNSSKVDKSIDAASDIALEIFIKKIEK